MGREVLEPSSPVKKKKPKLPKPRNPYVMPARKRKAGAHKNKASKRAQEDKSQDKYLNEDY